jgi:hypothetical protein
MNYLSFCILLACLSPHQLFADARPLRPKLSQAKLRIEPVRLVPGQSAWIRYSPEKSLPEPVFAHFGFNGWNLELPGGSSEVSLGNTSYFDRVQMRRDASGEYRAQITIPTKARALHVVFCWQECADEQWDNNHSRDYSWPVVFPYIGPIITVGNAMNPERDRVISIEDASSGDVNLVYWTKGGPVQEIKSSAGSLHRFRLTDLTPGASYHYQFRSGSGLISEVFEFKMPGNSSNRTSSAMRFLVIGDAQDSGESDRFPRLAAALKDVVDDIDFVISTGDLPWNDAPGDWWYFFDVLRPVLAKKLFMPAVGNHDTPTNNSHPDHSSFRHYFDLPYVRSDNAFHHFRMGDANFYGMNSERPEEFRPGGTQYNWLRSRLGSSASQQTDRCEWDFAYWHIPPFNAGARHYGTQFRMRSIFEIMQGRIDWQFSGHEHLYQRFLPIEMVGKNTVQIADRYGRNSGEGLGHVVIPSVGAFPESRLIASSTNQWLRQALAFPQILPEVNETQPGIGFVMVRVEGHEFELQSWQLGRDEMLRMVDSASYRRSDCAQ